MRIDYLKHNFPLSNKSFLLKLLLTVFFFGLAFRLLFFHSLPPHISPLVESPFPDKSTVAPEQPENPPEPETPSVPEHLPENEEDQVLSPTDTGDLTGSASVCSKHV